MLHKRGTSRTAWATAALAITLAVGGCQGSEEAGEPGPQGTSSPSAPGVAETTRAAGGDGIETCFVHADCSQPNDPASCERRVCEGANCEEWQCTLYLQNGECAEGYEVCVSWLNGGTCLPWYKLSGTPCCVDGTNGGAGTCNASGTCVLSSPQPVAPVSLPLTAAITDQAINKHLYAQLKNDPLVTTGVGGTTSGCIFTGGTPAQQAACLAQNVTGGSCNGLPSCVVQTINYNLKIEVPKVVFEAGQVKAETTLYVRSATHPGFERNVPLKVALTIPNGPVLASDLQLYLQNVYAAVSTQLATLGEIARDLKNHLVARLSPELTIPGLPPPPKLKLLPTEIVGYQQFELPRYTIYPDDSYTADTVRLQLSQMTLNALVTTDGRLELTFTPTLSMCSYTDSIW